VCEEPAERQFDRPRLQHQHVIAATLDPASLDIPKRKFAPFMNSYRSTSERCLA